MKHRLAVLLALALGLGGSGDEITFARKPVHGAGGIRPYPFATTMPLGKPLSFSSTGRIDGPALPDTLRLLAIRVDFQRDTLETTTGDGAFFHELPDSIAPEDWIIDPPPHDSLYFADQLLALRNYFHRFSRGKLTITGKLHNGPESGGDIFPIGRQAAYTLDYPIWNINWGDGDDERLNGKLVEMFVDAWELADEDTLLDPSGYDIFLVFHAGSGNEFDTGFDLTPHDIPSVAIGLEDLATYAGLPDGVAMGGGVFIRRGAILPETQRQGDIEIGLMGTVCAQVGYLIGMPHLYDTGTGDPGIGMFGLMDRGFGGFFGIIPTPPSAWMRAYMGWDSVTVLSGGEINLGALHLPDSLFTDSLHRLVEVPINSDEYFLLEARLRDPEADSMTVAYDRAGRRLRFYDDYTLDADEGFRVPVSVEDHDFDLPASGILLWHIDEGVIRGGIDADRIQVDPRRRGVDIEEADGTEDIGEEYEFLQPGDGSEYGVREDAWYRGNELFLIANRLSKVEFSAFTAPSTAANTGGESHIAFTDFSPIDDTMSCVVVNGWEQGEFPDNLTFNDSAVVAVTFADLDGDTAQELVIYDDRGLFMAFKGDGRRLDNFAADLQLAEDDTLLVAAGYIENRGLDLIFAASRNRIHRIEYSPWDDLTTVSGVDLPADHPSNIMIAGPRPSPHLVALYRDDGQTSRAFIFDRTLAQNSSIEIVLDEEPVSMTLLGTEWSDTVAFVSGNGGLTVYAINSSLRLDIPATVNSGETPITGPIAADFDGDGVWDIAALSGPRYPLRWWGGDGWDPMDNVLSGTVEAMDQLFAFDLDRDGVPELSGAYGTGLAGFEPSGVYSEGFPLRLTPSQGKVGGGALLLDIDGDGYPELIGPSLDVDSGSMQYIAGFDLYDGRALDGFPLEHGWSVEEGGFTIAAGRIDADGSLELVAWSPVAVDGTARLKVFNLPSTPSGEPSIFWGQEDGNPRRTRHLAIPASPAPGTARTTLDRAYCWPNPVVSLPGQSSGPGLFAHFRFYAESSGSAELVVYDLVGREIARNREGFSGGGEHEIDLNCAEIQRGVYIARLEIGGRHSLIRFAVVK